MKVTPGDFKSLKFAIDAIPQQTLERSAEWMQAQGYTHKRFRWDVFHHIRGYTQMTHNAVGGYPDYTDEHIDTALRRILGDSW